MNRACPLFIINRVALEIRYRWVGGFRSLLRTLDLINPFRPGLSSSHSLVTASKKKNTW